MINVLVIALQFAPVQSTGAFRSIAFVKYLSEFGIRPIVVTIEKEEASSAFGAMINPSLLLGLPSDLDINYIRSNIAVGKEGKIERYFRLLTSFDDRFYQRYLTSLMNSIKNILSQHSIDVVYASMPPFGAARLAESAAMNLGVPLIMDFRDSWAEWELGPHPTYLHYIKKRKDEAQAFSAATKVICTTKQMRDLFVKTHPQISVEKFNVIHNSFDGELFKPFDINSVGEKELFNIAYVGSYYYTPKSESNFVEKLKNPHRILQYHRGREDWSYRSPLYFFKAWQHLFSKAPQVASRIRFHHIGRIPDWLESMANDYSLGDYCKFEGAVPQQELAAMLRSMDALLVTSMKRKVGEDYFIASKTFEYLLAKKPILGFVTKGSQREFLENTGVALICDPDDLDNASISIKNLVNGNVSFSLNADYVNKFSSREMTKKLSKLIHNVAV